MSGRAETEMQIQIMIHGEAFCPSTMTKETPFANQLLEEITNNERNEMVEGRMEENEIEEGHDNVEEEQDNKAKDTPFANQKLLEDDTTNSEKNEMEEGQMQENEIKEGHENVEEDQDYKFLWNRRVFLKDVHLILGDIDVWNRRQKIESFAWPYCVNLLNGERGQVEENKIKEGQEEVQEEQDNEPWIFLRMRIDRVERSCLSMRIDRVERSCLSMRIDRVERSCLSLSDLISRRIQLESRPLVRPEPLICNFEIEEGQMEEFEKKERQKEAKETPFANRKLLLEETNNERNEMEEGQMEENEIKEGHDNVEEEQDNKRVIHIDRYERDRSLFYSNWALPTPITLLSPLGLSSRLSKFMVTRYDYSEWKQTFEEMKIRRLEIENFWKHALEKDMDIMRIFKSGSLRFLKQQIQDLLQLSRCKVCLDSDACMVFFPCRHMATCEYCGSFLDQCPVCRTFIEETVKVNKK